METLAPLVFVSSAGIALYQKKWVWPSRWILACFSGLLLVAIASFYSNSLPPASFLDYIGEFRWMISYLGFVQFFNLAYKHINFEKIFFTIQCVLIVAGFYSIYQFFTAHDLFRSHATFHRIYEGSQLWRPNAFFGLPTTYAYASAMFFCMSLANWLHIRNPASRGSKVTQFYFFISALNILLSFTRAAWIAFFASVTTLLYIVNKKLCLRIVLALMISVSVLYSSMPDFKSRIDSIFDLNYIANHNRIYLWKANWNIFKENPWVGIGFNENVKNIDRYLDVFDKPEVMRNHPHNTYLNFLAGLGAFGLSFFLLLVVVNLKHTIQGIRHSPHALHRTLYIGALGAQMVLLIGGITECNFEDIELTHQYILYIALVEYLRQQDFPV